MTSKTFIVLDDDGNDLKYLGNWVTGDGSGWYRGTTRSPPSTSNGQFNFTFEGTYVSFIGLQPSAAAITLTDSGSTVNTTTTLQIPSPSNRYVQWYRSPESAPGRYTIIASGLSSGSVDAILVGVDQKTPLLGKTLLVDDDEESQIVYAGSWTRNSKSFSGKLPASGWPIQNTTHETSTVGDLLTFRFTGTGLSIYGLFSWNNPSLLTLSYTLDNTTVARSYPVTPSSQEYLDKEGEVPNYLFFSYQNLRQGPHVLVINVTDVRDTSFRIDFLTYQPSFTDLSAMPVISAGPVVPTDKPSTLGSPSSSARKTMNVGAIAGGVLGGLYVLGLVAFLLWLRRRRRTKSLSSKNAHDQNMTPFADSTIEGPTRQTQGNSNTVTPFSLEPSPIFDSARPLPANNNSSGKGAIIRQNPPIRGLNSKGTLFEQRETSTLNTPSSASPLTPHPPTSPHFPKSRVLQSATSPPVSVLASAASSASSPSVAPVPYTSKAALERAAATAANNPGPLPPSYNSVVPTLRSKFSLPTSPS